MTYPTRLRRVPPQARERSHHSSYADRANVGRTSREAEQIAHNIAVFARAADRGEPLPFGPREDS